MPELLTTKEVAEILHLTRVTLSTWRQEGRGPKYLKLEGSIRYRKEDIEDYLSRAENAG
jgi:predicted site-specific integrase-resolvase